MARKPPEPTPDGSPLHEGLKHNPFAALRPRSSEATPPTHDPRPAEQAPLATPNSKRPIPKEPAPTTAAPKESAARVRARVVVRRERKGHGGKAVTIAEGEGLAGHDLDSLARDAARALGVGARTADGTLIVQGEQTDRLITWLETRGFGSISRGN